MTVNPWFERSFSLGLLPEAMPEVLDRLRRAPARLERILTGRPSELLTTRPVSGGWSAQEHAGHLLDLETLWSGRLDDLLRGAAVLREADLTNRRTHEADHNRVDVSSLLARFREERCAVVARLEALPDGARSRSSGHPRLGQPMTCVDLFYFVAEHDEHHLATIAALLGEPTSTQ